MLRLLNPAATIDYFWLFFIAAIPVALAYFLDAHQNHQYQGRLFLGYWVKTNFWTLTILLPLMLWVVRKLFNRIAPVSANPMAEIPPIIQLIEDPDARQQAYMEMRHYLSSPLLVSMVLGLAFLIQIADMSELLRVYFYDAPIRVGETDWSVMFAANVMGRTENFILVLFAYFVQYLAICFQCLLLMFLIAHNLFFLNRVYQRSRVAPGMEQNYIHIDLDDVNRCFGFRAANDAFNTQVVLLIIFGLLALVSRYNNIYVEGALLSLQDFAHWPPELPVVDFFPDIGQWLLSLFWLLTLLTVSLPALVKLLPRFSRRYKSTELSIAEYMKEFVPPSKWHHGDSPSEQVINRVAAKFAQNAFWPTGNNRASQLFFFSGWVFLFILVPIKTADLSLILLTVTLLGFVAYFFRTFLFVLLHASLGFIDSRLVEEKPELLQQGIAEEKPVKIQGKVFISYRREDASAYAKLIQQSLLPATNEKRLFMDRVAIHDGDDFVEKITDAVLSCDALLVVIGSRWASCQTQMGRQRISEPDDFVRLEIETGLSSGRLVIPVLVGGAQMPSIDEVPESLAPLLRRHARELSDSRWDYDVSELIKVLAQLNVNQATG